LQIEYNVLNLPTRILFKGGNEIINIYAADGRKLEAIYLTKITEHIESIELTLENESEIREINGKHYIGNFEYEYSVLQDRFSPQLTKIFNAEGYVENEKWYYFRKDHLGNNREVCTVNGTTLQTVQTNNYYPSGLLWAEDTKGLKPLTYQQPYKYNGKEYIEDFGYDCFAYGFRDYYATIGRFTSPDALSEIAYSKSPYHHCSNNPINRIDPDGLTDFKAQDGTLISTVHDGSNAVFVLVGTNQTNSYFEFSHYDGEENGICIQGVIAGAQDYVMNNYTQCNRAVNFVGRTYNAVVGITDGGGDAVNRNLLANAMGDELSNAQIISADKDAAGIELMISEAAAGKFVVGVAPGHVNMVTTLDFTITRYAKDGTSSVFEYKGGLIANVNGKVTANGLGPNKNNSYYPIKNSHITKLYSIGSGAVTTLEEVVVEKIIEQERRSGLILTAPIPAPDPKEIMEQLKSSIKPY